MLDDSGSTATTDPKKAMRVQTLQQFIRDYGSNTNESDSPSIANLTSMAKAGAGQSVDTNKLAAGGLVINDIISVPGGVCL